MQTLTSDWDREPLEVTDEIPTTFLHYLLGRTHVGTSDEAVRSMLERRLNKYKHKYTTEQREQTIAAGLWYHHENQAEYKAVMSGRF